MNAVLLDDIGNYQHPCVLAIGMFDGLHGGHMRVVEAARKMAAECGAQLGILTFSPHPSKVVDMGRPPVRMLFPSGVRAEMFAEAGADAVFVKNFDKPFAERTCADFGSFLKSKFPQLRGIATGENFRYGHGAKGDANTLAETAKANGWKYAAVKSEHLPDRRRKSSSLMRGALESGNLELFGEIAGRPYSARGTVAGGKKLGRAIGFPTLNIKWNPDCKPPFGVYAAKVRANGASYKGVANYGLNPTVDDIAEPVLETNLFENVDFGAGTKISVDFLKFLRPEMKFPSLDELKSQIAKDRAAAAEYFGLPPDTK